MAARKSNDKRPSSNAGTVFWLAAVVIVLFLFALNWGKIQETFARTNFHEIVKTQTDARKNPPPPAPDKAPQAGPESGASEPAKGRGAPGTAAPEDSIPAGAANSKSPPSEAVPAQPKAGDLDAHTTVGKPEASARQKDGQSKDAARGSGQGAPQGRDSSSPATKTSVPSSRPKMRQATLYFVKIDDDGVIVRQEVKRQIAVSDSPMLDAIEALLKGPGEEEIRRKLISLVPQGTKLLSAQVRGSTAVLNFNEAFMYNHYGIEGYAGQLKQIVYTATAFPTVQDVQILIEGTKRDYLGGEGVYIGRPLSRNSF